MFGRNGNLYCSTKSRLVTFHYGFSHCTNRKIAPLVALGIMDFFGFNLRRIGEKTMRKSHIVMSLLILLGAGIAADLPQEPYKVPSEGVMYRGEQRSSEWILEKYQYYKDKTAFVDGKYFDMANPSMMTWAMRPRLLGTIQQILGLNSMLLEATCWVPPNTPAVWGGSSEAKKCFRKGLVHLRGVNTKDLYDGLWFDPNRSTGIPALYVGTFTYVTVTGASHTVRDYIVIRPLTLKQFVKALKSDFELVRWEKRTLGRYIYWDRIPEEGKAQYGFFKQRIRKPLRKGWPVERSKRRRRRLGDNY